MIGVAIATYQYCIQPINSEKYLEKTNYLKPILPKLKRAIGRPGVANSGATISQSARAKQPIIRPHYPVLVQSSTPPPIPLSRPSQDVSAEIIATTSKGTTSRMFQFIPNLGFKYPRQK
ncbi:hypothetical protein Ahy_B05g076063 [Arachis hypogaea]|uniref:Uncharacterized protein n=1 Tax=Arachis hypogaea TaxID=3818 RepID=A0A444Z2I6_ARAHY|nr:hypothetical protein Ahy_B05g076063 [Arachis hypogaea]